MFPELLKKMADFNHLTGEETSAALEDMLNGRVSDAAMAGFLTALHMKGETIAELTGALAVLRRWMKPVFSKRERITDTCGTGGDGLGTFNISTAAAFVAAGAGVAVAKHGNKAVSGRCGSADLLDQLGLNYRISPETAGSCLDEIGITFLFAPLFHPALRRVAGIRRELGFRTLFNLLGPLANPAPVRRQVVGVYDESLLECIAAVLQEFETEHALVVFGADGMDEISPATETLVVEIKGSQKKRYTIKPQDFGIKPFSRGALRGGGPEKNASIFREVITGKKGAYREGTLINAAAVILVAGLVEDLREGYLAAQASIDTGKAFEVFHAFQNYTSSQQLPQAKE